MTVVDTRTGKVITVIEEVSPDSATDLLRFARDKAKTGLIWETGAEWAICKSVGISDATYHSFIGWHTNDQAWAFFNDTVNVPVWEYGLGNVDDLPQDITSDGTCMAGGTGNTLYGFDPSSGTPDWVYPINIPSDEVYDLLLSDDAETIYYVSGDAFDHMNITSVNLTTFTENWSHALPENGYVWGSVLSGNGERLVVLQYDWVTVYSSGGDVLFQNERDTGSQTTPAISDDGNIFVIGDYHGYVDVYEYDAGTYVVKWRYLFEWGVYYDWVTALAVSGDGGTIAAGSYQNDGDGQYSGELAVFDVASNVPLWVFSSEDDQISDVDISEDGSVIAAIGWGPPADGSDDFWLFSRDGNAPFMTYDCTGSPLDLDMSGDGARCIVGGKAVHARAMGHGGKLYCFDGSGPTGVDDPGIDMPSACTLLQNRPNPFNPRTTFTYFLSAPGHVRLAIYDLEGRLVATVVDDPGQPGRGSAVWNGRGDRGESVASGLYFARLEVAGGVHTRKITLTR